MSKIYFFRHAQASFMANNYDQLSEKGIQQSKILGQYLKTQNIQFDQVFSGPLERQQHTCQLVLEQLQLDKEINTIPELKEHQGTEAIKLAYPQLMDKYPQLREWKAEIEKNPKLLGRNTMLIFQKFLALWAESEVEVEGVEPWPVFRKDTKIGFQRILEQTGKGEKIAVFTSGGTIASIVGDALMVGKESKIADLNFSIRNTSFSTFLYSKGKYNMLSFNEIPHLSEDLITFV
ncbi:histidine phosphatase family protein [Kordia sp.]|uniref:histidine phosphatase family protein n=1 Tax=Kordia sp. TaxID=1965332 RepID=UPI0025C6D029|nr:histidine phosphatase family protein [Kordia sp.]MCH2083133.1 phosphoglycerate mutase family protein [Saprospiraceae bacterium]MCH2193310.1 phosphoglycerate mutase family protein [Kordia sp.]